MTVAHDGGMSLLPLAAIPRWRAVGILFLGLRFFSFSGALESRAAEAPALIRVPSTEQRWIITSVARDAAEMAAFAADPAGWKGLSETAVDLREGPFGGPGNSYILEFRFPGADNILATNLVLTETPWSPGAYTPSLQAVIARLKVPLAGKADRTGAMQDAVLLKALTRPLTSEIETQNQHISDWLQRHPLDAQAHQQAALLLGTLALRESAGLFWDPRRLCNRAAAHLAFARALDPHVSDCGEIANLLIGLIIGTQTDCQKRIAALQARVHEHPELAPWAAAATMRVAGDYRQAVSTKDRKPTLLEQIEEFRAISGSINALEAEKRMPDREPAPDWGRIALHPVFDTVSGWDFVGNAKDEEIADAALIFPKIVHADTAEQLAAILNQVPGNAVQISSTDRHAGYQVIDRGAWADFFQRHLLRATNQMYYNLAYELAVPEEAQAYRVQTTQWLDRLTLYPLSFESLGFNDREGLYVRTDELCKNHPELVTDQAWSRLVVDAPEKLSNGSIPVKIAGAWFSPRQPTGTVYGYEWRVANYLVPGGSPSVPEIEAAYAIAPLNYRVCESYVDKGRFGVPLQLDEFKRVMAPLLEFYLPAMQKEASLAENDPGQCVPIMSQMAALDTSQYLPLGAYLVKHKMEPEAVKAYQTAIDKGAESIDLSNHCEWLVNYYYDHGEQDRAFKIAQQAAEVYSGGGLGTMARLLERMDRPQEAEDYYQRRAERYGFGKGVPYFYLRQASKHPEYLEKLKSVESSFFPKGMEDVTLAQLTGDPVDGTLVKGENDRSRAAGLRKGAVIVGLYGKRVHSQKQYEYVWTVRDDPKLDLLVFQDGHYQELHPELPGRRFGVMFNDFPPPNPSGLVPVESP